ncbi:hypothetical protein PPL_03339 [Heterostelium album PN500]|uniref:Uncharacterized protein n=1 Tax=Heterostelium pallidum (strain ATCC 26659 / Pp 5 / PN500) TaxID=670386 RepID=D3B4L4_HETP5|nr:hypothetical protein PPL_03339 [Heterostelium album PN500]EFA84262.1 hypothetical protein PPL_03339 [Heterostelium album PN500]|eukprot:XP_020436378.1 hypothetical protein PPL_03339 [Heterostelium album PN500]
MGQSASVSRVSDNSKAAADAIANLKATIDQQEGAMTARFDKDVIENMNKVGVQDQKLVTGDKKIQTEYASEFNLENIKNVVSIALKTAANSIKTGTKSFLSDESINSFVDLVGAISESAKTNSSSTTTYSFLTNKLAPGIFVCISTSSVALQDKQFFGNQTAITTSFYYRVMTSNTDEYASNDFSTIASGIQAINIFKDSQVKLAQQFADGKIEFEDWELKDDQFSKSIEKTEKDIEAKTKKVSVFYSPPQSLCGRVKPKQSEVSTAVQAHQIANNHGKVAQRFKVRVESGYYGYITQVVILWISLLKLFDWINDCNQWS